MRVQLFASMGLIRTIMAAAAAGQGGRAVPRTPDGRPDLTGFYDANTITPIERPAQFGRLILTGDEAAALGRARRAQKEGGKRARARNRRPPPAGGNVGGYNDFWMSRGNRVVTVR